MCFLCKRKAERKTAGTLHKSTRQVEHEVRQKLSPADRYRRQLETSGSGYSDEQISAYVAAKYPDMPRQDVTD